MNEKTQVPQPQETPDKSAVTSTRNRAMRDVFMYGLARVLLFAVILAALIGVVILVHVHIPVALLAVLALIIALPASMLLFTGMRTGANQAVAEWDANRKAHKEYVRRELADRGA